MYTSSSFFYKQIKRDVLFLVCVFFVWPPFSEKFSLFFFHTFAKKLAPKKFLCFATKKKFYFCSLFVVSVLLRFFLLNKKEEEEESAFESV